MNNKLNFGEAKIQPPEKRSVKLVFLLFFIPKSSGQAVEPMILIRLKPFERLANDVNLYHRLPEK